MTRALYVLLAMMVFGAAFVLPSVRSPAPSANSAFPKPALDDSIAQTRGQQVAVVSGGCFWGVQAVFEHIRGVVSATSGYAGGTEDTAHYEMVSTGQTGHAESVKVIFDPSQITYGQLLMVFLSVAHNPTELNKQGPDWGSQYRSSIFYSNEGQKRIAEAYIAQLNTAKVYTQKIVTVVVPLAPPLTPGAIESDEFESVRLKPGVADTPARSLISPCPAGVPPPVARS